jgi:hypothetical protein
MSSNHEPETVAHLQGLVLEMRADIQDIKESVKELALTMGSLAKIVNPLYMNVQRHIFQADHHKHELELCSRHIIAVGQRVGEEHHCLVHEIHACEQRWRAELHSYHQRVVGALYCLSQSNGAELTDNGAQGSVFQAPTSNLAPTSSGISNDAQGPVSKVPPPGIGPYPIDQQGQTPSGAMLRQPVQGAWPLPPPPPPPPPSGLQQTTGMSSSSGLHVQAPASAMPPSPPTTSTQPSVFSGQPEQWTASTNVQPCIPQYPPFGGNQQVPYFKGPPPGVGPWNPHLLATPHDPVIEHLSDGGSDFKRQDSSPLSEC